MTRTWVYQRMANDTPIATAVQDRVFQATSIDKAPTIKPFIVYRQTSDVDFLRGDDHDTVRSCGYMILVHDLPGDYVRIDLVMRFLQDLFKDTNDGQNSVIRSRWIETSDDQRDDDMGTIMKYCRIQVFYRVQGAI